MQLRTELAREEVAWEGCGQQGNLVETWQVDQFYVHPWDDTFHDGSTYIVLHTAENMQRTVYMWMGSQTTESQRYKARYKTYELINYFGGEPTEQVNEMGSESPEFTALFGGTVPIVRDATMRQKEEWEETMWQIQTITRPDRGGDLTRIVQAPWVAKSFIPDDSFVLETTGHVYLIHGQRAGPFLKVKAKTLAEKIHAAHPKKGLKSQTLAGEENLCAVFGVDRHLPGC